MILNYFILSANYSSGILNSNYPNVVESDEDILELLGIGTLWCNGLAEPTSWYNLYIVIENFQIYGFFLIITLLFGRGFKCFYVEMLSRHFRPLR